MKKARAFSVLLLIVIMLSACSPKVSSGPIESDNDTGTTQPNLLFSNGLVAEHDGFLYFTNFSTDAIYEYDSVSGSTVQLPIVLPKEPGLEDLSHLSLHSLSVHNDRLYMSSGASIYSVQFDGKDLKRECSIEGNLLDSYMYIEYPMAYYMGGDGGSFVPGEFGRWFVKEVDRNPRSLLLCYRYTHLCCCSYRRPFFIDTVSCRKRYS